MATGDRTSLLLRLHSLPWLQKPRTRSISLWRSIRSWRQIFSPPLWIKRMFTRISFVEEKGQNFHISLCELRTHDFKDLMEWKRLVVAQALSLLPVQGISWAFHWRHGPSKCSNLCDGRRRFSEVILFWTELLLWSALSPSAQQLQMLTSDVSLRHTQRHVHSLCNVTFEVRKLTPSSWHKGFLMC